MVENLVKKSFQGQKKFYIVCCRNSAKKKLKGQSNMDF